MKNIMIRLKKIIPEGMQDFKVRYAILQAILENEPCLLYTSPDDLGAAKEAMKKAYEEGRITKDRLDKSVRKILLKKVEQNLLVLE